MYTHKELTPFVVISGLASLLTILAAAIGLFTANYYPIASATYRVAVKSQDLIAFVAALIILAAVYRTWQGSTRAVIVWAGCLGYLIYSYLLLTMDKIFTPIFPVYIAILGLCLYSLIGLLGRLNADKFRPSISESMPVRFIAVVLAIPLILIPPWIAFISDPVLRVQPNALTTVNVIDLSFVIPACLLSAYLIWRKQVWGYVFSGVMLVKMFTMGLSLVIATFWANIEVGTPIDPMQTPIYAAFMLLGGWAMLRYLSHLRDAVQPSPRSAPLNPASTTH